MAERPARPAGRYGEDQPTWHRVAARAAVITLALLGVGWVVWAGLAQGSKPVSATVITWTVVDPSRMSVSLDVTMKPGRTGSCTLLARNRMQNQVGQATVRIPASDRTTQRVVTQIRTQERGASATVENCRAD